MNDKTGSIGGFFGVTDAGFGVGFLSGEFKGEFYTKYEFSYNVGVKSSLQGTGPASGAAP